MYIKNVNNKKCAPKLVFFNEKKIKKDSDDFLHRKFTLKVQFGHFLPWPSSVDLKKIHKMLCHFSIHYDNHKSIVV